jgi:hypothetical protein
MLSTILLVAEVTSIPVDPRRSHGVLHREERLVMWLHAGQVKAGSDWYGSTKKESEENATKA